MDEIKHSYIKVNGLKLHVAEIGSETSPAIIFLHGFPEIWYTWRRQMIAVAEAGYRAIAPDYRGYGLSDIPAQPEKTSFFDLVKDTASILDSLNISKVFVIGKDFGSMVGYTFALFHPEKVIGIVSLGVAFRPPGSRAHQVLPEGYYINRWKETGRAEADFGRLDAKTVVRNIYILFSKSETPIAAENQEIMDLVEPSTPLPSWFTEKDLSIYGSLYEKSGFQTPLQVPYRILKGKVEVPKEAQKDLKVEAPTLLIMGEKDFVFKLPGTEEYIRSGEVKKYVPNLETIYVPDGSHFIHEQFPDQVNKLILSFLDSKKH
ncbi:epoxide hydrolase 2-like [Rutidosis leptorrhynchoides]|uniref:epoxide hydrolase 2-like n=1 Tax=Rutidosis leptorrhynchoides TaxID=125765 RepID=UPI003A99B645